MTNQTQKKNNVGNTQMNVKKQATDRYLDIQTMVHLAARSIAPVWPLKTFIACNSLHGFESRPFDRALTEAHELFNGCHEEYEDINRETIKWCKTYFDEGQKVIDLPSDKKGFYAVFKDLGQYDKMLHQGSGENKQRLRNLPDHPIDAILECLAFLQIPAAEQLLFLKRSMAQLPGFSGYIKWKTEWQTVTNDDQSHANLLIDFMAIRLVITVLLRPKIFQSTGSKVPLKPQFPILSRIKTLEENYQSHLIPQLLHEASRMGTSASKPAKVQMVFCIDVRSEPFRRFIESQGPYETLGFAGFFGLPVRLHDYNTGNVTDSCPVLLKPRYDIHDAPCEQNGCARDQHEKGEKILNGFSNIYQQLKYNFATPFALVEGLGAWFGILMLFKTLKPSMTISTINQWIEALKPTVPTEPLIDMTSATSHSGIAEAEQVLYAEAVLRMMGLTENFGEFVIFCGHGSSTQNNPYASGLDCGACGGNHGGGNAKVLASLLNKKSIQATLAQRGIHIPPHTQFLAAEHNTTTDDVVIFENTLQPILHGNLLRELRVDLAVAKAKNAASRVRDFEVIGRVDPLEESRQRSQDWSEVRPEWGLARNAAFIVGPRKLTQALNLEGRCFLHSYDWENDQQLTALETILTAPMVVAEWINTQYLFSTIDNVMYGSGSKVTHNVTGKIGIMQGNGSDLMHGLPLQSVKSTDDQNYHQPQRLLTVVYAPREQVSKIINRQDILKNLFFNAWVHLLVIEPSENEAYMLQTSGEWNLITFKGEKNVSH